MHWDGAVSFERSGFSKKKTSLLHFISPSAQKFSGFKLCEAGATPSTTISKLAAPLASKSAEFTWLIPVDSDRATEMIHDSLQIAQFE